MKWLIASDIHGSAQWCRRLLEAWDKEQAGRLLLLGDVLYHGPRNDLPDQYAPKEVITMLNARRERILCVRGNCEAEVDQMVLEFPVLADYAVLWEGSRLIYCTHGHVYNTGKLPPLQAGDVLQIRFACSSGALYLSITAPDGTNIYSGDGRQVTQFSITVPSTGDYTFCVTARHGQGHLQIQKEENGL